MNEQRSELEYQRLYDLLPAYGMGITDVEDTAWVERILPKYPELHAELADYRAMQQQMLGSANPVVPPRRLKKNLLNRARESNDPAET